MIRIQKSAVIPKKLLQEGKRKRKSYSISYSHNPSLYQSGTKKFSFDRSIYAHETVKKALIAAQHGKCCFCERLIGTDGDVEHFRPKQAYKQSLGEPLQRPGYYWLAYEWDNLYLACPGCNQRHKQNLFPLKNPADRAISHRQNIADEQPLFIDPGKDDPEEFIGFRGEIAFPLNNNLRGQATCDSIKLNGRSLPEARLQRLQILKRLWQIVQLSEQQPNNTELQLETEKAKALLDKAKQTDAEFSAASSNALRTDFRYVID
ncbi:MAG: hypothetical protein ACTS2F_25215 [Thainema sp.]